MNRLGNLLHALAAAVADQHMLAMAGLFLMKTPVFGVIGGISSLGEQITPLQLSGIGRVMLGLCWVLWVEAGDRPA